jgi:tRNA/rRNA methyltransferase/tRNA (cytidine32/uridine32-2'-O)-methyltransferase
MSLVTVLCRPQDIVNVAGVIRVMKNFGLRDLRLVAPAEYDERRIEGIAHGSADVLKRVAMFDDLDGAIQDCTYVAGMTGRQRAAKRNVLRPRPAAEEILREAAAGTAAILLGPEDRGLSNDELDRCHRLVTIPTSRYQALNLSHAFAVMAYELHVAGGADTLKAPRRRAPAATAGQLERLFGDAERALDAIEFFKTRNPEYVMRTVRDLVHRTPLDAREAKLLRAMCIEVVRYLERVGVR